MNKFRTLYSTLAADNLEQCELFTAPDKKSVASESPQFPLINKLIAREGRRSSASSYLSPGASRKNAPEKERERLFLGYVAAGCSTRELGASSAALLAPPEIRSARGAKYLGDFSKAGVAFASRFRASRSLWGSVAFVRASGCVYFCLVVFN